MTTSVENTEEKKPSVLYQLASEISENVAWAVKKTVAVPLRMVGSVAEMAAAPFLFAAGSLTIIHIAVRPEKSKEIARKLLYAAPKVIDTAIISAPEAMRKIGNLSERVYRTSLQALGDKVCLKSKHPHQFSAVMKGLVTKGPKLVASSGPQIKKSCDDLLTFTGKHLTSAHKYVTKTAIPKMVSSFNKTFPEIKAKK